MAAELVAQALALPVSIGIFANGIEEVFVDFQYFLRGLHRRERRAITHDELMAAPARRIAIMVPAWHEAPVIENMLDHNCRALDYDSAQFDIFCGTYQNDPETQERVAAVARRRSNVHKVVVPHDGPTSKADCLNWIYQGIVLEETRRGQRFDILLMHDSEDVIHPLALRLYSLLVPHYDFVQTPVFSLPLRYRDVVASTYIDEFAEHHLKDMLVRESIGGLIPSAGVGSAFARDAFEEIALANHQHPFNVDSLTEDYEVGLKFRLAGKRVHFACRSLQKTRTVRRRFLGGERTIVEEELIATREYFPNHLTASIRQRARWITGIALQTWHQVGWQGPAAVRWCLWRDRKVVAMNSLLLGAYALFAAFGAMSALTSKTVAAYVPPQSALWWLMTFNLLVMTWRFSMKMSFVGRLYGAGHALASVPRVVVANLIGLAATARAVYQYAHHLWTGQPLRWAKTAHEYPSFELLASQQRRLGEFLVDHGRLDRVDIEDALAIQAGTGIPLGEVISSSGMMSARAITEALGENLSIPYAEPIPDDVPLVLLRQLPESLAAELHAMPVSIRDDGVRVVAMPRAPTAEELRRLSDAVGGEVRTVLAEREAIRRGRWRAYRRLVDEPRPHVRLGEALLARDAIDIAQLDSALEEQLETGERLGEIVVERGYVTAENLAAALASPRAAYRSIRGGDIDIWALERIGYGLAAAYQLAPLRNRVVASPHPIHPLVLDEIARRLGYKVTTVLAAGLEVRVALAVASRRAWPGGIALHTPGLDGEELSALLAEPALVADASQLPRVENTRGLSPIDQLVALGRLDADHAHWLHARALGLPVEPDTAPPADGLLPPELVAEHGIRVCEADKHGFVFAAPNPTPALIQQVAELFIERAIGWRVIASCARTYEQPCVPPFKEAV